LGRGRRSLAGSGICAAARQIARAASRRQRADAPLSLAVKPNLPAPTSVPWCSTWSAGPVMRTSSRLFWPSFETTPTAA